MAIEQTSLFFRIAKREDIESVVANEIAAYRENWSKKALQDSLKSQYVFYVLEYEESIVGHLILHPILDECHLLNVCVNPKFQGIGIGKDAIQYWLDFSYIRGFKRLILEVRQSNQRAIQLYRQFGFEHVGLRKGYYPSNHSNQIREDGLVMCRSLP